MTFSKTKGCLYLDIAYENIDLIKNALNWNIPNSWYENRTKRDGTNYHITVVNFKHYNKSWDLPVDAKYQILGLAIQDDVAYLVCYYHQGNEYCRKYNVKLPDFHITIGFAHKDKHNIPKDITTITDPNMLYMPGIMSMLDQMKQSGNFDIKILEHLGALGVLVGPQRPSSFSMKTNESLGEIR